MSALSLAARDYLTLRRSLGHQLVEAVWLLPRFVAYLDAAGTSTVTVEAALAWSTQADPGTNMAYRRMAVARGFARHMAGIDPATEVPPLGLLPATLAATVHLHPSRHRRVDAPSARIGAPADAR